ncbi:uncharacterized protein [Watersipora subatra]|uniref:uncharacterized protein n=1 Tax=Watersipora subatra TaxID=2589382 RepID=UPI00355B4C17
MTDFLEDEVLKKWSRIRNAMRKTESRISHAHQCDIVSSYSDTKNEIQRLIDEIIPSVEVPSVSKVRGKSEVVSKLTDGAIECSWVYGIDISGDRLIVANCNTANIAVLQLQP